MPAAKPLTDVQKKTVMDLFTTCDGKQLTAADLKSIMESLDKAGIQGLATRTAMKPVWDQGGEPPLPDACAAAGWPGAPSAWGTHGPRLL